MATKSYTRVWGAIALLAGIAIGVSYGLDWLGLSVDGIVRDDVVINDVAIPGSDLATGVALLIVGGIVALCGLFALLRPAASRTPGWLTAVGGLATVAYVVYVYVTRDDTFSRIAVDRVASDDVPAESVERAIDLALRGGVDVLAETGLIVAGVGGLVALVAGILLTRRVAVGATSDGAVASAHAPEPQPGPEPVEARVIEADAQPEAVEPEPGPGEGIAPPEPASAPEEMPSGSDAAGEPEPASEPAAGGEPSERDAPPDDSAMWRT